MNEILIKVLSKNQTHRKKRIMELKKIEKSLEDLITTMRAIIRKLYEQGE